MEERRRNVRPADAYGVRWARTPLRSVRSTRDELLAVGTTGGGSAQRGTVYGEFDHIVWSTMEADGPHITNLLLDGIMPANVVTEQGITRFRDFLRKATITVAPILIDDVSGFSQGQIDPRLINYFDVPIELSGQFVGIPLRGLSLDPANSR